MLRLSGCSFTENTISNNNQVERTVWVFSVLLPSTALTASRTSQQSYRPNFFKKIIVDRYKDSCLIVDSTQPREVLVFRKLASYLIPSLIIPRYLLNCGPLCLSILKRTGDDRAASRLIGADYVRRTQVASMTGYRREIYCVIISACISSVGLDRSFAS